MDTNTSLQQLAYDLAHCIAIGEGYCLARAIPFTQRNPGDLTHSPQGVPQTNGKCAYKSHSAGWTDLEDFCRQVLEGRHLLYPPTMTILEFATRYVGGRPTPGWLYPLTTMLDAHLSETITAFVARKLAATAPNAR